MNYHGSDFLAENLHLRQTPTNKREAQNKLTCLQELAEKHDPRYHDRINLQKPSKRQKRLLRVYWAYYMMEKRKAA